jgi:hypothetical protein
MTPVVRLRLAKLCGMLGSAHAGERAAAALKADQLVRAAGQTWHDVIEPQAAVPRRSGSLDWRELLETCLRHSEMFSQREQQFMFSMQRWRGAPTPKQADWLVALAERVVTP